MPQTTIPDELTFKKFTHDKTPELCLFYNIALDRINNLVSFYEGREVYVEQLNWENQGIVNTQQFSTNTYLNLQVYLWKEPLSDRFSTIKAHDIEIINKFLHKLVDLRNYHSHYYHDSEACKFPPALVNFVVNQFEKAKNELYARHPNFQVYLEELEYDEVEFERGGKKCKDVYRHFEFFDPEHPNYITPEGKNFFLSFFLLKGEMNKFLKKRSRCKRDNGEKYQVKTNLYTYYCHRDNSSRFFLQGKKEYLDSAELLRRQYNTILNYLKTKPVADRKFLPPTKEIVLTSRAENTKRKEERLNNTQPTAEETPKDVIRRRNKFFEIAIRYFMDREQLGHNDGRSVYWYVENLDLTQVEKVNALHIEKELSKFYSKKKPRYTNRFAMGEFPVFTNRHVKFKLGNSETDMEFAIGEREMKNWMYYLLTDKKNKKSFDDTLLAIETYGKQYKEAMEELVQTNHIAFEKYPRVFPHGIDSVILSEMHKKLINKDAFNEAEYRTKIEKALNSEANLLAVHLAETNYTRNKKNRIIIECFNWYLPLEAKLKPTEINKLSIFNFVAENERLNPKTRRSIVNEIAHKLNKATEGANHLVLNATSLNGLFKDIINKKLGSLAQQRNLLPDLSVAALHILAGKLGVSLPGISQSRTGINREDELKQTVMRKPVLLPNGFFKHAFDANQTATDSLSTRIAKNNRWLGLLIENQYTLTSQDEYINQGPASLKLVPTAVLQTVETHYDALYKEFKQAQPTGQTFKDLINVFVAKLPEPTEDLRKPVADALNLKKALRETQVQDALLAQILFEYLNPTLPLEEKEAKHQNIAELFEAEYTLKVGNKTLTLKYKQLDDLATHWDRAKLTKLLTHTHYWSEAALALLQEKGKQTDQQKVAIQIDRVFEDSFYFIRTFLEAEAKVMSNHKAELKQLLEQSREVRNFGMPRVEPEVLIKKLLPTKTMDEVKKHTVIETRKSAFHTDVPESTISYEAVKTELASLAGITIAPKRDKKRFEEPKKVVKNSR